VPFLLQSHFGCCLRLIQGFLAGHHAGDGTPTLRWAHLAGAVYPNSDASHILVGWTADAGVEYAFSEHWSLRTEARYTDFSKKTFTIADATGAISLPFKFSHTRQTAGTVGVSYKF